MSEEEVHGPPLRPQDEKGHMAFAAADVISWKGCNPLSFLREGLPDFCWGLMSLYLSMVF